MNQPMANLPVVIFQFAMSPYDDWHRLAWGGAALITLFVLGLNIAARVALRARTRAMTPTMQRHRTADARTDARRRRLHGAQPRTSTTAGSTP